MQCDLIHGIIQFPECQGDLFIPSAGFLNTYFIGLKEDNC